MITDKTRAKISKAKLGSKNPNWVGNKVGYQGVHGWVKRHKVKSLVCENCKSKPPYDLANISQKYLRDLNDFWWLCRKCHMESDGRLKKLASLASHKGETNGLAKFTLEQINEIRNLFNSGNIRKIDLARKFKIHRSRISNIINNKSWKI